MDKLKNLVASALEKGFATPDERQVIVDEAENYSTEELGTLIEDIVAVENLPAEKPENTSDDGQDNEDGEDEQEGNEGESESVTGGETRAERRERARAENKK